MVTEQWIIVGHFVDNPNHIKVLTRGLVPVDFYIVLSGGLTSSCMVG